MIAVHLIEGLGLLHAIRGVVYIANVLATLQRGMNVVAIT